ncbi:MAG: WD40/YVTN/BNR-like repeat-containing protein [Pyrinomonadaceae bacterium]
MSSHKSSDEVAKERNLAVEQVTQLHKKRGLSNKTLSALPDEKLRRLLLKLEYPNFARLREDFRFLQERNENGVVPSNAIVNALSQMDSTRTRGFAKPRVAGVPTGRDVSPMALVPPTAGLNPNHTGWTDLGPGNIGGRTRSIVIHPQTPNTMWVGSVGGGVWRTDDGGDNWGPVDDLMANLAVSCMVMDPTNPDVIYAGTGEGFSNVDALRGAGIFQTTDGVTWKQLSATTAPPFQAVNRLAMSKDGKVLLAATLEGVLRSEDGPRQVWTKTLSDPVADLKFDPSNKNKAVAGGLDNGQAYYSTDGGKTWKVATPDGIWSGRVELTYAAQNSSVVYASVDVNGGEVWRSADGGKSYSKRDSLNAEGDPASYLGEQGWYGNVIWAGDPTNSDMVIVGGVDLWRSTDGGNTLIDISTWWDRNSAHADHHCIASHPGFDGAANKTVFFSNDGGVYMTNDVNTVGNDADPPRVNGWRGLAHSYGVTQFFSGAGNVTTGVIIGGAQDNGTLRYTPAGGTQQWTEMYGGDGGWCASDPTDGRYFYGEYVFLNIHRSTDEGASAEFISGQYWHAATQRWRWKPVPYQIADARLSQALFIAPFILDPNNPERILGGGMSLWRTNNARATNTNNTGPVWAAIKNGLGVPISAITVAAGNPDIIWVGHAHRQGNNSSGDVYKTINGTSNSPVWVKMDDKGAHPLPDRFCTRITIDPSNRDVVYVTFGGYSRDNIWRTVDGGLNWSNIGNSLPEAPVRSLVVHPRNSDFLYVGTEVGVFASEDAGQNWSATNEGPTNCSVEELFWMGETLACATHGRGMFQIDLSGV